MFCLNLLGQRLYPVRRKQQTPRPNEISLHSGGSEGSQSLLSAAAVAYPRLYEANLGNRSADIVVSHGSEIHLRDMARREGCHLQKALGLDNHTAVPGEN
jgi:hypothetical protein